MPKPMLTSLWETLSLLPVLTLFTLQQGRPSPQANYAYCKFPYFRKMYVFCFPLIFYHDAFMHHALHVLDISACPPYFHKICKLSLFAFNLSFSVKLRFLFPPILTMMHLRMMFLT